MSCRRRGKTSEITGERIGQTAAGTAGGTDDDGAGRGALRSLPSRLDVSGTQVCASTLASVSAAVVASLFGATGTLVGAALMSVVTTTGSAVYGHGLRRTGARLQETSVADVTRRLGPWPRSAGDPTVPAAGDAGPSATTGPGADPGSDPGAGSGAVAGPDAGSDPGSDPGAGSRAGWRAWLARRRWGLVIGMAIVFLATLGIVTLVELAGQRSLAGITGDGRGRTSIGSVLGGSGGGSGDDPGGDDPGPADPSTTLAPGEEGTAPETAPAPETPDDGATDPTAPAAGDEEGETPSSTAPSAGAGTTAPPSG